MMALSLGTLFLWFVIGYTIGLLLGPYVGRNHSPRSVSIRGGIAGALGATAPFVFLTSVWAQEASSSGLVNALVHHARMVSIASCLICITLTETFRHSPPPRSEIANATPISIERSVQQSSRRWLWLCVPAVIYSLWVRIAGQPITIGWLTVLTGALCFVGLTGYLVSLSVLHLRGTKQRPTSNPP